MWNGIGTLGTFVTMCVLAVEITGARYKSLVGNLVHLLWAPGQMALALLAFYIRDWRHLHLATSIPIFLALLLYPITPESPRWLAAVGRYHSSTWHLHTMAQGGRGSRHPPHSGQAQRGQGTLPPLPATIPLLSQPSTALSPPLLPQPGVQVAPPSLSSPPAALEWP